ncbi:jacalin-related lectin 34 [Lactuca sativa]|uniref:jacalin-related lectin 34 n=1 Tax=Lactuca sativa TaxID=4236 RepID=UPI001C68CE01|nr:jacalin-related lectin 34 [Lactuca sativa]
MMVFKLSIGVSFVILILIGMVNIGYSENLVEEEKTSFRHGEGVRKAGGAFDDGCDAKRGSSCGLRGKKRLNLGMGVGMGGLGMRFGFGVGMGTGIGIGSTSTGSTGTGSIGTGTGSTGTGTGGGNNVTGSTGTVPANIGIGTGDGAINKTISIGTMDANGIVNPGTETGI